MSESVVADTGTFEPKIAPGGGGVFVFKQLKETWKDPLNFLAKARTQYGDVARFQYGWIQYFVLHDPNAIHHVLVENHRAYKKSRNYAGLKIMLGEGLLTSEGDFWRRQRRLAQPAFHKERLQSFADMMVECTADMLERWKSEYRDDKPFDVHREMMRLTFRIVGRSLLGAELDGEAKEVGEALNVALEWTNEYVESILRIPRWMPTPANRRFAKAEHTLDAMVQRVLAERRNSGVERHDLLGMLISAKDEATGEGMSDKQLRDELLTLTLAGHETTANALTFTLYLLSRHPDVRRTLEAEVKEVLGDRAPSMADLPKLRYTTMVVEEAMRLYPPAWIIERDAIEDDVVAGFKVPKGASVGMPAYTVHRHPELWPNPEGFDPLRFTPEAKEARPKHAYLPFGGGPRFCIGNAFAMMELAVILPMIVQQCRLDLVPGFELRLDPSVTLRPRDGVTVVMMPSRPSV